MSNPLNSTKMKVLETFEVSGKTCLTSSEVASKSDMNLEEVLPALQQSPEIIQSTRVTDQGESLYSTKEKFRKETPFLRKIIGAFSNRID